MIKLIATDIDGTLLKYDFTCPAGLTDCLKKLEEEGIKVVPVTGRMHRAAIKIYNLLNLCWTRLPNMVLQLFYEQHLYTPTLFHL